MSIDSFKEHIQTAYAFSGNSILLGGPVYDKKAVGGLQVSLPLATINRHGLIAGATGTGKTKSIQRLAESLSKAGVSVLLMDIKGDASGLARPGTENPTIRERITAIGTEWVP